MKLYRSLIVLAVFAWVSAASAGETKLTPGLWQVDNKMSGAGGQLGAAQAELQKQLAAMPPEQRKMMETMMAGQGMKVAAGGSFEVSGKICMTQEMIDQHELPVQQGKCKTTLQSRSGNAMKMKFECTDPPASGEGQYTIVSPEAYTMKMTVRAKVEGGAETMIIDATGKRLGADCGAVKPKIWLPSAK